MTTGGVFEATQGLASNSGSFSSTILFDGGTLVSSNFNFSSYKQKTFVKVGVGGIHLEVPANLQQVDGFLHSNGESDGGVHVNAHPVVYFSGTNDHKGGTWLGWTARTTPISAFRGTARSVPSRHRQPTTSSS